MRKSNENASGRVIAEASIIGWSDAALEMLTRTTKKMSEPTRPRKMAMSTVWPGSVLSRSSESSTRNTTGEVGESAQPAAKPSGRNCKKLAPSPSE